MEWDLHCITDKVFIDYCTQNSGRRGIHNHHCFNRYSYPELTRDEFWALTYNTTKVLLLALKLYSNIEPRLYHNAYLDIFNALSAITKGCGKLMLCNYMSLYASFKLLPDWIMDFAIIDPESYYCQRFEEHFTEFKANKSYLQQLTRNLQAAFRLQFDEVFMLRTIENIMCKTFRWLFRTERDIVWLNLIVKGRPIFVRDGSGYWQALWPSGDISHFAGKVLISHYPYGHETMDALEIANSIPYNGNTLPRSLSSIRLWDALLFPTGINEFDIDFQPESMLTGPAIPYARRVLRTLGIANVRP